MSLYKIKPLEWNGGEPAEGDTYGGGEYSAISIFGWLEVWQTNDCKTWRAIVPVSRVAVQYLEDRKTSKEAIATAEAWYMARITEALEPVLEPSEAQEGADSEEYLKHI